MRFSLTLGGTKNAGQVRASVRVLIGSVFLFLLLIGVSIIIVFMEDGDTTPASSASRVPQNSAVAEPAEVDCADWNTTAFFEAAEVSDVIRCLQAGADLNARDGLGITPLHGAARTGTVEMVTALLEAGADPNARDGLGITPLYMAAEAGSAEAVTALLQAGANPNARNRSGYTPLHNAARTGSAEAVTALLEAGADPNARTTDGRTPLHVMAGYGSAEAVTALLEAGADPNALDRFGFTPLHSAAQSGSAEVVRVLLRAGADPNARNKYGQTPLDDAKDNEQLKGTDVYWKLNDARFQSSGSGTDGGIGTGSGDGVGSGTGLGVSPGEEIGGGVFRVGGSVSAPQVIFKVDPEYSGQAREAKHEGTVVLNVVVQRDGTVRNVRVVQSLGLGLDEKAIEAVQKWRFRPGMKSGEPVDVAAIIEVTFRLL